MRVLTILTHLLIAAHPQPRSIGNGNGAKIIAAERAVLKSVRKDHPLVSDEIAETITTVYPQERQAAATAMGIVVDALPALSPFGQEAILGMRPEPQMMP